MMACPYNARLFHGVEQSYHGEASQWERKRYPEHARGVVDKCDFCKARVDEGLSAGLTPGADADATPVCVGACIADALTFGDLDDPTSEIVRLIDSRGGIQLLEEMKTDPSVYYLPRRAGRDS
jgi:phenylacetyl-CoA:acceptor oxidoreductase subunit 1